MQLIKSVLLATVLVAGTALASNNSRADDLVLKEAASMMGTVLWLSSGAPGLVLAVVRGDEALVLGFGETRPGSKVEPDGRSILRMGSIAKVMAGHVLASMAADGTVKLTDALAKYAPPGAKVPAFAGRQITLLDLATYTAGLPRDSRTPRSRNPARIRSRASRPTPTGAGSRVRRCLMRRARARCTPISASACSARRSRRPAASLMRCCSTSAWRNPWA